MHNKNGLLHEKFYLYLFVYGFGQAYLVMGKSTTNQNLVDVEDYLKIINFVFEKWYMHPEANRLRN